MSELENDKHYRIMMNLDNDPPLSESHPELWAEICHLQWQYILATSPSLLDSISAPPPPQHQNESEENE